MENNDYQIEKVYLTGGRVEQTEYMAGMGDNPDDFRKNEIAKYENDLDYLMEKVGTADSAKKTIMDSTITGSEDANTVSEKIGLIDEREKDTKIRLAVANAALNFFRNEERAHGFAGIQIVLKNGNRVSINSGFYDREEDRINQYTSDMKTVEKTDIGKVLGELAKVDTATIILSINDKNGHYSRAESDIQYLQPPMTQEAKTEGEVKAEGNTK